MPETNTSLKTEGVAAKANRLPCGATVSVPPKVIAFAAIEGACVCVTCKVSRAFGETVKALTPLTLEAGEIRVLPGDEHQILVSGWRRHRVEDRAAREIRDIGVRRKLDISDERAARLVDHRRAAPLLRQIDRGRRADDRARVRDAAEDRHIRRDADAGDGARNDTVRVVAPVTPTPIAVIAPEFTTAPLKGPARLR